MIQAKVRGLIWDQWELYSKNHPEREAIIHWDILAEPVRWTYGGLIKEALKVADQLIKQGINTGDVCAIIIRHNKYFYPIYAGISAIGAIPAVLAYPNPRLHPDKFKEGLAGMAKLSGLDWILTERDLEPIIKPLVIAEKSTIKGMFFPLEFDYSLEGDIDTAEIKRRRSSVKKTDPFLLQHSSGTTGLQKAVVLSHKSVLDHVREYSGSIDLSQNDKVINWLPLYHDMGLIAAFHMPLITGIPSIQIDPFQWVLDPSILFQAITREKATLTWLPNFSYNFMVDRIPEENMKDIDLSNIRMFVNCSEVVRPESHDKFFNRFQNYGVKKESLAACYAMAETTFAVTQTKPGTVVKTVAVDRNSLSNKIVIPAKSGDNVKVCMSSGETIKGCSIKITDAQGNLLPEGRIGKIVISSTSLFDGYRNNPEKTKKALKDGWYHSGDIGFVYEGEYFIIGREDDVIIAAGRNIYPEDIEDTVNKVKGIIPGRVIAFGVEDIETGTQDIHVVAETIYDKEEEKEKLKLEIKQAGMSVDVTISIVHLVPQRWLIKSSSGKPSRKSNRERILSQSEY